MKTMKTLTHLLPIVFFLQVVFEGCQPKGRKNAAETTLGEPMPPYVERLHPDLDMVVYDGAAVEILAEGFEWTEGPLWVPEHDFLLFSDIPANSIYRWRAGVGTDVYLKPSGYTGEEPRAGEGGANGLLLGPGGRLILCQHGDRRIAAMDAPLDAPEPVFNTLTATWQGKRYNSPNDAVFRSDGKLYFTDPPYGLEKGTEDPKKEIPFQGVFMLDTNDQVHLLTDECTRPNGIGFSPDEQTLYIANSDPQQAYVKAFDVEEQGLITNGRIFADMSSEAQTEKGLPDGMAVHSRGYIFATGPGGVWILNDNGQVLGKIRTGEATSNCALDSRESFLYITADMFLMRLPLKGNI